MWGQPSPFLSSSHVSVRNDTHMDLLPSSFLGHVAHTLCFYSYFILNNNKVIRNLGPTKSIFLINKLTSFLVALTSGYIYFYLNNKVTYRQALFTCHFSINVMCVTKFMRYDACVSPVISKHLH
ncbi:hypothetical protein H1C71_010753 [Ictidomys tridecemlineatus]|nr:hypothetical protein H1C71_010753 [Ictidomys tridecemlineatus]